MQLSRRDVMKYGLLGSAAMLLPLERVARTQLLLNDRLPASALPKPFQQDWRIPPVAVPHARYGGTDFYSMHMSAKQVDILGNGKLTTIWGYDGTTPGPTIHVERGRRVAVRHCQELPATHPDQLYPSTTSVHLHGSASLPQYDGYASDITATGHFKDYYYPNLQDARTLWYHDHGIHHTANNAYMGLAAQYHLHDDNERKLGIPVGPDSPYDVPFVIRDAMFAKNGELIYADNSESGIYGDVILVNGVPWPNMKVERRVYRFRFLNASISRGYKYRLSTGDPFTIIATDGGLMPVAQTVGTFRHGMAERYEVLIDFSKYPVGTKLQLLNDSTPNNIDYDTIKKVMQFEVVSDARPAPDGTVVKHRIPGPSDQLNPNPDVMNLKASDAKVVRNFKFERKNGHWTVNGETWENVIESGYTHTSANPGVGDTEIWELENSSGGWFHPVHIHLIDFKILSRSGGNVSGVQPYELGPKDVVYVGEGEKVRVIMKFDDTRGRQEDLRIRHDAWEKNGKQGDEPVILPPRTGRYMMHCHNLVHEDHDMMVQFEVGKDGPAPWSPHGGDVDKLDDKLPMDVEPTTAQVEQDC
jgi:FtsP/CotA-like multicopper oxidase with cupredoxin domain